MSRAQVGTSALQTLERAGVRYRIHQFHHDPRATSYGLEAADALGVAPERIFKTLLASDGAALVIGIVPVTKMLDLKALAAATGHKKLAMADRVAAERSTGMVVGGISPIGQKRRLTMVLDESAMTHSTILVSGGKRGLDIELAPQDLLALTNASTRPIATTTDNT